MSTAESPYTASNAHRTKFKQDMPPPGGYTRIIYQRTFPKTWANARRLALATGVFCAVGLGAHFNSKRTLITSVLWENDGRQAMDPFLKAERDRQHLKHLRKIRDTEDELMKDVPGWKTGTWYGEPMYFTLGDDKWWDPGVHESLPHISPHQGYLNYTWEAHPEYQAPQWYDKFLPQWFVDRYW